MSSHREAPEISKDPTADNTDVYAFVDTQDPTMVNLIANWNPFEVPYGGPNFNEFADDVLYTINISNRGTGRVDISYRFRFETRIRDKDSFLYNTGPINSITDPSWNRPQTYTVTKLVRKADGTFRTRVLGRNLLVPPCNVGERSTPNYDATYRADAVHSLGNGRRVFAGQRADAFFVDLGSVFDLAGLRPINPTHVIPLPVMEGMNGFQGLNCHTIALQIPIRELSASGHRPTDKTSPKSVIGVWSSTFRSKGRLYDTKTNKYKGYGPLVQVSRLANPLFNELMIPMAVKDRWNHRKPKDDHEFAKYALNTELGEKLPGLYPNAFNNLDAFNKSGKKRTDIHAIFLTGLRARAVGGAFTTYTGAKEMELLRLNLAVPPTTAGQENNLGVLGGDNAGFPNGRRVIDDVTTIEIRALAGATIPFTHPDYQPDPILATDLVRDGTTYTNPPLLTTFPFLGTPNNGYATAPPTPSAGSGDPVVRP